MPGVTGGVLGPWPWIALGGALGAVARAATTSLAVELWGPRLPWGTLVVNVVGSVVLGALVEWVDRSRALGPEARSLLATGLLGAFTTFSTFSVETVRLVQRGEVQWAMANVGANVVLAVAGAAAGIAAVRYAHGAGLGG